ncbi:MAG: diguanylate cyclase [Pseudomonadota bacterium]
MPLRTLSFQRWGQDAGLPQVSVPDMARDASGHWWVATENGLTRFDGKRFETFRPADTPALKAGWVSRLHLDDAGQLWIGTIKNLARFDGKQFSAITAGGREVGRVSGFAVEPGTGALYVAADGLFRFHQGQLQAVTAWTGPTSAALGGPDAVWVAAPGRLVRIAAGQHRAFAFPAALADAVVTQLAWASDAVWLATTRGLLRFAQGRFELWPLEATDPQPSLQSLAADGADGLWAGGDNVLYRLQQGRVIERLDLPTPGLPPLLMAIKATPDELWLGSKIEGFQHSWIGRARRFSTEDGLADPLVWSYWADPQRLLIGTNSGVAAYEQGQIKPLIPASALPNPVAYSLLRDSAGQLWVGTRAGLARFRPDGQPLSPLPAFAGLQINGLKQDRQGAVWVATAAGLFRVEGDQVRQFGEAEGLKARRIRYLLEAQDGMLWVGTESGLFRQQSQGRFENVVLDGQAETFVTSMAQLADGRLVVGSYERGLFLMGPEGWQHWGQAEGLPSQSLFFVAVSDAWLVAAGSEGAYRIPIAALAKGQSAPLPVEVLVDNPGEQQGRARIRCCNGAGNGKGVIVGNVAWLPTLDGALRVQLDGPVLAPPITAISAVEHQGKRLPHQPGAQLQGQPRDVHIRYTATEFRNPDRLQFRYRLNGFDKGWVDAGERRTAIYTNLPPKSFTLEVQARHPFGLWGPSAELMLHVPKRFVETWTFRGLCAAILLLLLALFMRWRLQRLEAQKQALEAVVEERTRALAESNFRLASANEELRIASLTDALTGLRNRRYLEQYMPPLRAQLARRRSETARDLVLSVVLIDLDHFKAINDRYGHAMGDVVLQRVAAALSAAVRESEFVLRWGGEEFLAILSGAERSQVGAVVRRLHRAITESCESLEVAPGQRLGTVTGSLGFAVYPMLHAPTGYSWQIAIEAADHALYAAKAKGRNCCVTLDLDRVPHSEWTQQIHASDIARWLAAGYASEQVL